jgi:hypothetical protein
VIAKQETILCHETLVSCLPFTDDLLVGEVQLISGEVAGGVLVQDRVSVLPHGP